MTEHVVRCADCGANYVDLGLDLVLPDQQWKVICPENQILCANCICHRAARYGGTAIVAWINNINYSLVEDRRHETNGKARRWWNPLAWGVTR